MSQSNIKKNYFYNLAYQILNLIIPLITTPYISRVLGSSGVGQYSFTYSIVTYFTLFGALGFTYYAQREIARFQENKKEQSKIFYEVMIARLIPVLIALAIYFALIITNVYGETYTTLMWIMTINVVSVAFDVSFMLQGNERFGFIALVNSIIRILGTVGILMFVKGEDDVWLYALLQSVILIVANLSLWIKLPPLLTKVSFRELKIKRHFPPTIRLFIPTIAISVYTMLDKTLIGVLVSGTTTVDGVTTNISDIENGYYEQAEKIVKMAMTVITSLGTVMIPRNSQAIAVGNIKEFKKNIEGALQFVYFLGSPIMFGLAAVACNMSPWFFGEGYEKVPYLIMMFSPLIMIIGFSNVLGLQYLLPLKKDNKYTISVTSGAILNLILNIILIHYFWSYGACIASLCAELFVTVLMFIFARKDISFIKSSVSSWRYIVSGIVMFAVVFTSSYFLEATIINTLILIAEGIVSYIFILVIFRDSLLREYMGRIKSVLLHKKANQ